MPMRKNVFRVTGIVLLDMATFLSVTRKPFRKIGSKALLGTLDKRI
jgi:hypothetical protein